MRKMDVTRWVKTFTTAAFTVTDVAHSYLESVLCILVSIKTVFDDMKIAFVMKTFR